MYEYLLDLAEALWRRHCYVKSLVVNELGLCGQFGSRLFGIGKCWMCRAAEPLSSRTPISRLSSVVSAVIHQLPFCDSGSC